MMTLRQQVHEIAVRWVGQVWADTVPFGIVVDLLAAMAFDRGVTPTSDVDGRAIARARHLMRSPGWIGVDERGVES